MTTAIGRARVPEGLTVPGDRLPRRLAQRPATAAVEQDLKTRPNGSAVDWVDPPAERPRYLHPEVVSVPPVWAAFRAGPHTRLDDRACPGCGRHFLVQITRHRSQT